MSKAGRPRIVITPEKKYNHLTAKKFMYIKNGFQMWLCQCDCNNKTFVVVSASSLNSGHTKSCGCLARGNNYRHGHSDDRIYNIYHKMIARCYRKKDKNYPIYGGRGISVCIEWRNSFQSFYNWAMKSGYRKDLSIDRIDVNGNYEPSNCRWATCKQQQNNRRNNRRIKIDNEERTLAEWSEISGVNVDCIYARLKLGWSNERAVFQKDSKRRDINYE